MPVPGRQLLSELRHRLDLTRTDAARVRGEYDGIDHRMDEYVSRRGEAIVELARHDLPDISQASVEQTFAGIRDDLRAILARKERAQAELQGRLERCHAAIAETQRQVAAAAEVLNRLVARRAELEQQAAERLKGDDAFQALSRQALAAEMQLKANEERAEELQLDAAEKLPAYDRSRLFGYLYTRRFGTPEYASRGWIRSWDRWLARLIDFERHRKGYDFLRQTPELVKAEVERRRVAFHAQMEQVEAIEERVSDDVGLTGVLQDGTTQGAEHDRLTARLAQEQAQVQQVESELHTLNTEQGRFHAEALERYTRFLNDTETSVLQSRASQTTDPRDDEIVSRIAWLTQEIERLRPEVQGLEDRSRAAEQRSEGLSFVVRRAEQANLDSERCTVEDLGGIETDVERFVAGAMNQNDLWRAIQDRLKFEPTWVESAATGAGQMLNHPGSHILLQALAEAASVALQQSAQRSVQRRAQVNRTRRVPVQQPMPSPPPPTPHKGFTTRGGF